ncbi:MAG: hypothetical protein K6B45_02240 [Bacteroidaceae bacterium]|nr:hypothetical protein [Bacteroidaceae bacterium]
MKKVNKKTFDLAIKQSFLEHAPILPDIFITGEEVFGRYVTTRGITKYHDIYFSEDFGKELKSRLSEDILKRYKKGNGNELISKFFSVASSSRFAVSNFTTNENGVIKYINSYKGEKIEKIEFEHGLPIQNVEGTPPQLDVWFKTSVDHFVEVKCHEIFDTHKIEFRTSYSNNCIFKEIQNHYKLDRSKIVERRTNNERVNTFFSFPREAFGIRTKTNHFDLKQFICHLMGIVSNTEKKATKEFCYLFYHLDNREFDSIYEELNAEIEEVKTSFSWFFEKYNIKFHVIFNNRFSTLHTHVNQMEH